MFMGFFNFFIIHGLILFNSFTLFPFYMVGLDLGFV